MTPFTHSIPPTPASAQALIAEALRHFRTAQAEGLASDVEEYHFRLALDELLTNAIRHGASTQFTLSAAERSAQALHFASAPEAPSGTGRRSP